MQILKLQKATGSNRKIIFKGTGRIKLRSQLRGNWPTPKRGFQTDAFQFFLIRNNVPYNIQFPYLLDKTPRRCVSFKLFLWGLYFRTAFISISFLKGTDNNFANLYVTLN